MVRGKHRGQLGALLIRIRGSKVLLDLEQPEEFSQIGSLQTEKFRRSGLIALGLLEGVVDNPALELPDRFVKSLPSERVAAGAGDNLKRQVLQADLVVPAQHHCPLYDVFQLPHISRPMIGAKAVQRLRGQSLRGFLQLGRVLPYEVIDQYGDVLSALPQGR